MGYIRGVIRIIAAATIVVVAALLVVGLSWIPLRIRGVRLSAWPFTLGTRMLLPTLGLKCRFRAPKRLIEHRGFIFTNHISYMDILAVAYLRPMRFVAKAGVKDWPFIGWIAAGTGTMFVKRDDKASRARVRKELAEQVLQDPYPPVVVFPEGTRNPKEVLLPFRYGGFDVAAHLNMPYMLCAITYERPELVTWQSRSESLLTTVWRLVKAHSSYLDVIPLEMIQPHPEDSPEMLANQARDIIGAALETERTAKSKKRSES